MKNINKTNRFIDNAIKIHGDRYNYSKSDYIHSHSEIIIICKIHGEFNQVASYHLQGSGCKKCQYDNSSNNYATFKSIINLNEFLSDKSKNQISIINFGKLDYRSKIDLCCNIHGIFKSSINSIVKNKFICNDCRYNDKSISNTKTTEDYINQCMLIHKNTYDYSKTIYTHAHEKAIFICKKHGEFNQFVGAHASGSGCPKCRYRISKPSQHWLNSLNDSNIIQEVFIEGKFVDGYDPITNTIYEFYGDYWHGNPNTFNSLEYNQRTKCNMGELYQKTLYRSMFLKFKGYNIVEIWEKDFKERSKSCDRLHEHAKK